ADALDKLEAFASFHGPDFYRLPRNTEQITLTKQSWQIPDEVAFVESGLVPLGAGSELAWQIV
ncbi:MAG: dihydroorotase, partial [Cyanobacteria bacterium J06576_12]